MTSKEQSIEELCKPLSAKVMPRSERYTQGHEEMSNEQAQRRARQSQTQSRNRKIKLAERAKCT